MKIRNMVYDDLKEVFSISKEAFGANSWTFRLFEDELTTQNHYAFVGICDNQIVCFLTYMLTEGENGPDYNILNLATKTCFQKQGCATKMLEFLKQNAIQNNYNSLWLEVRESNINALNFYKKFGFSTSYIRKYYYSNGDNAIIMTLKL